MRAEQYGLEFHHFGLAVTYVEPAVQFLEGLGYAVGDAIEDPVQRVLLRWCGHPSLPAVEMVSSTGESGPLDPYLSKSTEVIYHLCFEALDAEQSIASMKQDQIRVLCVSPPKPAVLFGGRKVSFYSVRGFGLIELLHRE